MATEGLMDEIDYVKENTGVPYGRVVSKLATPIIEINARNLAQVAHDELQDVLNARIIPPEGLGVEGEITVLQGLILATAQKGIRGNISASKLLLEWYAHGVANPSNAVNSPNTTNIQVNNSIDSVTLKMLKGIGVDIDNMSL